MFLLDLFRYKGDIPISIALRASTLATITKCYVAFDKDGTCHIFPVKPLLLEKSGIWSPRGRKGAFQCEEVRFTIFKYKYTNWKTLFSPVEGVEFPLDYKKLKLTRRLSRKTKV